MGKEKGVLLVREWVNGSDMEDWSHWWDVANMGMCVKQMITCRRHSKHCGVHLLMLVWRAASLLVARGPASRWRQRSYAAEYFLSLPVALLAPSQTAGAQQHQMSHILRRNWFTHMWRTTLTHIQTFWPWPGCLWSLWKASGGRRGCLCGWTGRVPLHRGRGMETDRSASHTAERQTTTSPLSCCTSDQAGSGTRTHTHSGQN